MVSVDIFLSYSHQDIEQARSLAEALSALGWSVFWDRRIPPGRTFEDYLEERIRDCRALVVMWSPHSYASKWVKIEASYGRTRGILIPVLVAATEIPFGYNDIHAADLTGWKPPATSTEFDELVSALDILAPRAAYASVKAAAVGHIKSEQEITSSTQVRVFDPPVGLNARPAWFTRRQRFVALGATLVAVLLVASWAVYREYRSEAPTLPTSTRVSSNGATDSGTPTAAVTPRDSENAGRISSDTIGPKPVEAAQLASQRCDSGDAAGCTDLGVWYLGGERGLTKNIARATTLFKQACDHGDANGCDRLGDRYRLGDSGLPKDVARARALYEQACDGGAPIGCEHLETIAAAETSAAKQRDERSVRSVLEQYRTAFNNLDAVALSRVASDALAQVDFSVYRSYAMTLSDILVQIDGDSAVVRCTRQIDATSKRGNERLQRPPQTMTMKMRRTASSWIIESVS